MYSSTINGKIDLQLYEFWSFVVRGTTKNNKNIRSRVVKLFTKTWVWVSIGKEMGLRNTKKVRVRDPG